MDSNMDQMMDSPFAGTGEDAQTYTAGVPIPGRCQQPWPEFSRPEFTEMRDEREPELGTSAGAAGSYPPFVDYGSSPSPGTAWHCGSHEPELARNLAEIQIDDIFEDVDVADLIPGVGGTPLREPTLTELNATDDLGELSLELSGGDVFGDARTGLPLVVKQETFEQPVKNPSWPAGGGGGSAFSSSIPSSFAPQPGAAGRLQALVGHNDPMLPSFSSRRAEPRRPGATSGGRLTLQALLAQPPAGQQLSGSAPHSGGGASLAGRLSSSVPCESQLEQRVSRLTPLAPASRVEQLRGSSSSVSTGVLSPGSHDSYADDVADSPYDHYSDSDSDAGEGDEEGLSSSLSRKERYFWQYNVQAKGPKGQRIQLTEDLNDPRQINQAIDPVFSSNIKMEGIKHSGKARRGDGNDLTPSPRKLLNIQRDLDKLNRLINDMTPVSELPFNVRPKSRKEKNKLASRACRLKKKAQHEANKIQLAGLGEEHRRLTGVIQEVEQALKARVMAAAPGGASARSPEEICQMIDCLHKQAIKHRVAGHLPEFVQRTLDRHKGGSDPVPSHTELG